MIKGISMQNRFGLKDFVFLVLLLAIGGMILLSMMQEDRVWDQVINMNRNIERLESQMSIMERRLEEGIEISGTAPRQAGEPVQRDDSWARPDVEVEWQERPTFVNDPRDDEEYALGGEFIETFGAQPPTLTPYIYRDVYGRYVIDQVVETLGRYHPETAEMTGVLAEAWQMDPDGMWLRVKIWDNARFSDGEPVTAEDVRFSHEDIGMNPEIQAERYRSAATLIDSVEVIDDKVIEFTFEEPRFNNKSTALTIYVIPKHFYEDFTSSQINESTGLLMGSGPFRMRNLDPDNQYRPGRDDIVLVRNEQYWGPRAALDGLRFEIINDELAELTNYRNRNADMMQPTPRQFNRYRDDEDFTARNNALKWYNLRSGYSFIAWNTSREPFDDARVRRAMTHLIDRERIIRNIMEGIGEVATGPFNPRTDQANPEIEPLEYNVDRARELLAEAGWEPDSEGVLRNERGDRFSFTYTVPSGVEAWEQIANYLRDQSARVGIRCEVDLRDWAVFSDMLRNRDFDALSMAWSLSAPETDPHQIWHSRQIGGGGDNFVSWENERADELIDSGRREMDFERRIELWRELHEIIHEEQPYTFMVSRPWLRFVNKRTENVHTYRTGLERPEFFMPLDNQQSPF